MRIFGTCDLEIGESKGRSKVEQNVPPEYSRSYQFYGEEKVKEKNSGLMLINAKTPNVNK